MRGSLFDGKVDKDTLVRSVEPREHKAAEEENIGEQKKASKTTTEEDEKHRIYLQQQQISCSAAQPRLAPSGGAPFSYQPRLSPLSSPWSMLIYSTSQH
jgi:FtsZ-interacting cell division protein ZipA